MRFMSKGLKSIQSLVIPLQTAERHIDVSLESMMFMSKGLRIDMDLSLQSMTLMFNGC